MPTPLDPTGGPIQVGSLIIRTPGLRGTAEAMAPELSGLRAQNLVVAGFDEVLESQGLELQAALVLTDTAEVHGAAGGARSTAAGEPALAIEAPAPAEGWGQVLLATDESGVMTWSYAEGGSAAPLRGMDARRTFLVRRHVPPPAESGLGTSRGFVGAVGKKVLKVLAFRLIDEVAGKVGDYYGARWEAKKRPYRVREFSPDDYTSAEAPEIGGERWRQLAGGRALLFVHGTFSRAHTGFGLLPRQFIEQMQGRYGGRVFAFDHYTLSEDPRANVEWLVRRIPDGTQLELDIICHSRGGLVSRVLAEQRAQIELGSHSIDVRRVAFVGTPNQGTRLADPQYFGNLVDTYTSLFNLFPDTGALEVVGAVISVVKQIAVGAVGGLDGLTAMTPGGKFLKALNAESGAKVDYSALASDFEPVNGGFKDFVANRLADAIFSAENDLVVPTASVYGENGSNLFPVKQRHLFGAEEEVGHTRYFGNPTAQAKLSEWLAI